MGRRSAIGPAQIETPKTYCSFVYDLCDRAVRIVAAAAVAAVAAAAGIYRSRVTAALTKTEKKKAGATRDRVEK